MEGVFGVVIEAQEGRVATYDDKGVEKAGAA